MLRRSLCRTRGFFPVIFLLLFLPALYSCFAPLSVAVFARWAENLAAVSLVLFCSFLLPEPYEIALGLTCGVRTTRLVLYKLLPFLLYLFVSYYPALLLFHFDTKTGAVAGGKVCLAVSFLVTVLFFTMLFLLVRVLTRSCYLSVPLSFALYLLLPMLTNGEVRGIRCLFDPLLSGYLLGKSVLEKSAEAELTALAKAGVWTYNRILFFVLALLLFGAAYLVLRREHLHQGFGE